MIPEGHKTSLITSGISFVRTLTEAYGAVEGMELWEKISEVIDPELKGQMFFAMLTGDYNDSVTIKYSHPGYQKISCIKAVRDATEPRLGLKECKDIFDALDNGKSQTFKCIPKERNTLIAQLRSFGVHV